jgi:hypothetical protein
LEAARAEKDCLPPPTDAASSRDDGRPQHVSSAHNHLSAALLRKYSARITELARMDKTSTFLERCLTNRFADEHYVKTLRIAAVAAGTIAATILVCGVVLLSLGSANRILRVAYALAVFAWAIGVPIYLFTEYWQRSRHLYGVFAENGVFNDESSSTLSRRYVLAKARLDQMKNVQDKANAVWVAVAGAMVAILSQIRT